MIEELDEKIKTNKEVLSALPQNNQKNKKIYKDKVNALLEEYKGNISSIKEEIERRNKYYTNVVHNENINATYTKLNDIYKYMLLFNPYASSYEISTLDKLLYKLGHYYHEDINAINKTIFDILNIFKSVNVNINNDSFNYSYYSKLYLEKLFSLDKTDESYLEITKELFKEYYWKCPDLLNHITLNLKYLYYINKSIFDNYYSKLREKMKNTDVKNEYITLRSEYEKLLRDNKETTLNIFLQDSVSINDYDKDKILKTISTISSMNDIKEEEIMELKDTLVEYKEYMDVDYIIKDIKTLYADKLKYKGIYNKKKKEITKKERKVFAENKKIKKYIKNNNLKKLDYYNNLVNNRLNELKNDYEELERNFFLEKVSTLNESSTIEDILELTYSNYNYLVELVKKKEKSVEEEISKLSSLVYEKNINLINNIWIDDNKDLETIICDKYNILGFKLTREMLDISSINSLIKSCEQILGFYLLKRSGLDSDKIRFIKESKKILEETSN